MYIATVLEKKSDEEDNEAMMEKRGEVALLSPEGSHKRSASVY